MPGVQGVPGRTSCADPARGPATHVSFGRRTLAKNGGRPRAGEARCAPVGRDQRGRTLKERIYIEQPVPNPTMPEPVPVTHSAAFIQNQRGVVQLPTPPPQEERSQSGIGMAISSADERLDSIEASPPKVVEAFSDAISSDTGKNVRGNMVKAAQLTVDVGFAAAKTALPVAAWMMKTGATAILSKPNNNKKKNNSAK
mmetsp:Transcript_2630/g.6270  ORF Transcript_2630/g.6270 Transcript_2630/m.6270 type:complete len:198 (+) Transcript_2630:208-801(+)